MHSNILQKLINPFNPKSDYKFSLLLLDIFF